MLVFRSSASGIDSTRRRVNGIRLLAPVRVETRVPGLYRGRVPSTLHGPQPLARNDKNPTRQFRDTRV